MPLPRAVQLAYGVELRIIDFQVAAAQEVADATGTAVLQWDTVELERIWRVERLVVQATSAANLNLAVTDGVTSTTDPGLRDFGQLPNLNQKFPQISEYPSLLTILGGQTLTLIATGAAVGDVVTASAQYQIVIKVPVSG